MVQISGGPSASTFFLWPALAAAAAGEIASACAKEFARLATGTEPEIRPEPRWATSNTVLLELGSVRLRDFSVADGHPTLVCAPFALHDATIADLAPGHSLIGALLDAGLQRLLLTHWRSATPDMRFLSIDNYLDDLNVIVDDLGAPINLIGLCQGGWLALAYAARFPAKIRKLVLAGAPIDVAAGQSTISRLAGSTPMSVFEELVRLGDGRILGKSVLGLWADSPLAAEEIRRVLQSSEPIASAHFHELTMRFRDWFACTVDLPGTYYLEVVQHIYKENRLANGRFMALGQRLDLATVTTPLFLIAARNDEMVAPEQIFATEQLVGTAPHDIRTVTADSDHYGLFMGRRVLQQVWPDVAEWILRR